MSSKWIRASKAAKHSASSWVAFWDVLRWRSCAAQFDGVRASGSIVHDQNLSTFHPYRCWRKHHLYIATRFRCKLPGTRGTAILACPNVEFVGGRPVDGYFRIDV